MHCQTKQTVVSCVMCLLCEVIGHKALLEKVCRENSSLHEPLMSLIRRITSERQWRDEETENRSRKRKQAVRRSAMDERSTRPRRRRDEETNVNRHAEATENRSRTRKQAVRRSAMDERSTSRSDY